MWDKVPGTILARRAGAAGNRLKTWEMDGNPKLAPDALLRMFQIL
jgi:hypothetical protein